MTDHATNVEAAASAASAASAAVAGWATKATYTGAGALLIGWLTSSQFGVLAGLLLGFSGFLVNWYYKAREDRRQEREHQLKVRNIQSQIHEEPPQ